MGAGHGHSGTEAGWGQGTVGLRESRGQGGLVPPLLWAAHSLLRPLQSLQRSPGFPSVRGCLSMAPRPACAGAQRRLLARPLQAGQGSSPQGPLGSCSQTQPWRGGLSASHRSRVAMAGEAISLARPLLGSSRHSLFLALRGSRLKQVPSQTLLERRRGHSASCLYLLCPLPARSGAQALAGPSLSGASTAFPGS